MKKFTLSLLSLALASAAASAADPVLNLKGNGTESDPWLIETKSDLLTLASACNSSVIDYAGHYAGNYFKMTADIDLKGERDFYGIATAPMSQASSNKYKFQGVFDGQGHKISNMEIDGTAFDSEGKAISQFGANQSRKWVGLFGLLGDGAVVRNVVIDDNCIVSGISCAGGIAGAMEAGSTIENCSNYATVTSYTQQAGGITGDMSSTATGKPVVISNCFNAGSISVNDKYGGGIAGRSNYGSINYCANAGSVMGFCFNAIKTAASQTATGGIAGYATASKITDCINYGDVMADQKQAGGIAGYFALTSGNGFIKNCINTGSVWATAQLNLAGNIVGDTGASAATNGASAITNCYYDAQLLGSNQLAAAGVGTDVKGLTTAQLTSGSQLDGIADDWKYQSGDYPAPASINETGLDIARSLYVVLPDGQTAAHFTGTAPINTTSPDVEAWFNEDYAGFTENGNSITATPGNTVTNAVLSIGNGMIYRSIYLTTYGIPFTGHGTEADPYVLADKNDLAALADITNTARNHWQDTYFIMANDIDMAGIEDFKGIGAGTNPTIPTNAPFEYFFSGNFDGKGYTLKNMSIDGIARNNDGAVLAPLYGSLHNCGLFGSLGEGAVVKNLTLDPSCSISGYGSVGGISGALNGSAIIDNCHVAADITAYNRYSGGIFGYSAKYPVKITNSTFTGHILSNYDYVGGIAGWDGHADAIIDNCVNAGRIEVRRFDPSLKESTAASRVGGIAAVNTGRITNSASYGSIDINLPETVTDINGIGGLVGQNTNSGKNGSMQYNVTTGQVSVKGGAKQTYVGSAIGYEYHNAAYDQGELSDNYVDYVLNVQTTPCAYTNTDFGADRFISVTTQQLTSGNAIESLASGFVFEPGYYPMPKALATRDDVRRAASTFMLVPEGQTINNILSGVNVHFNDAMPLEGSLTDGSLFSIKNNTLTSERDGQTGDDVLTLTNGYFSNFYPIHKDATSGIENIANDDADDPVVNVSYYAADGTRVANPERGRLVIAVTTTASGRQTRTKTVAR